MPGDALARIRGLINFPSVTEVNVRSGPATSQTLVFKVPVGMSGQRIVDVQIDSENKNMAGKVYQWFKLLFDGGASGWVRDDLIEIQGDCTKFGYPDLATLTYAFDLVRGTAPAATSTTSTPATSTTTASASPTPATTTPATTTSPTVTTGKVWVAPGPTTVPILAPVLATGNFPDSFVDGERVRKAAYGITASWEGGYGAINNYDSGIVSYGFLQFTLAGGSLISVIQNYLGRSQSETANGLRALLPRIEARDPMLRNDQGFLNLLKASTNDPAMIDAQHEVGTKGYWQQVYDGYIVGRALKYPLTWALLFDMGVNFGVNHGFIRMAETELGVPSRSKPSENGLGEEQLMTYVCQLRKRSHYNQAEKTGFTGLKRRADFWMDLFTKGDWYLRGDASGQIYPNSRTIKVV
jgi:hypothetical protein